MPEDHLGPGVTRPAASRGPNDRGSERRANEPTAPDPRSRAGDRQGGATGGHEPLSRRSIVVGACVVIATFGLFLVLGITRDRSQDQTLSERAWAAVLADSIPLVGVAPVSRASATTDLTLPATIQANHEAGVYARATGYIKEWYADLGSHVRSGQLLAVIEDPDLDQQLAQGRQEEVQARAALALSDLNLQRWKLLYQDGVVTKQSLDTCQANYDASAAAVAADSDNVLRLVALVGFEQVRAPFDGVLTARNVDVGTFVTATGTTSAPQPAGSGSNTLLQTTSSPGAQLFAVARTDTVRIYVGIPETYLPSVRVGLRPGFAVAELRGRAFTGHIVRTAESVDAASRTLLTEVDALNSDGTLLPGMYAEVHFRFEQSTPPILMPSTAMIFRTGAPQAAVVAADSTVHFRDLRIGRDLGSVVEVDSGLVDGDLIVVEPSDDLRDGQHVHVEPEAGAPGGAGWAGRPEASEPRPDSTAARKAHAGPPLSAGSDRP